MKKILSVMSVILVMLLLVPTFAFAAGSNTDTLADWNIKVESPSRTVSVMKSGEGIYYIYPQSANSIPYVMLKVYDWSYDTFEDFFNEFTDYMDGQYDDLKVVAGPSEAYFGDKYGCEFEYAYTISGYPARDRRIVVFANNKTYMFASKEIEQLDMTVGTMLDDVVAKSVIYDNNGDVVTWGESSYNNVEMKSEDVRMYLYCDENGMPRYWLDMTGTIAEQPILHCYFRDGEETFHEAYYILNIDTADFEDNDTSIRFYDITDENGNDVSNMFRSLVLSEEDGHVLMYVRRDRSTLAGGVDSSIQSGEYELYPIGYYVLFRSFERNGDVDFWFSMTEDENNIILHKVTKSGEELYKLVMGTSEWINDYMIAVREVQDITGKNIIDDIGDVTLANMGGEVDMTVRTIKKTPGKFIQKGTYTFTPVISFTANSVGPYTESDLGTLAQWHYLKENGRFVAEVYVDNLSRGKYEIVLQDGRKELAVYTVDAYGIGTDIDGNEVDLRF